MFCVPARFALCELENLHDKGIVFEPIHRVVFGVDKADFVKTLADSLTGSGSLEIIDGESTHIPCNPIGAECIAEVQKVIDEYIATKGGVVDYIHGLGHLKGVAKEKDGVAGNRLCLAWRLSTPANSSSRTSPQTGVAIP